MKSLKSSRRQIERLIEQSDELHVSKNVKMRLKWLLYFCKHGENVSLTCRYFGIARTTFLRWAHRFDLNDISSIEDETRAPHHVRVPTTDEHTVELIKRYRIADPLIGKDVVRKKLAEDHNIHISASTIGRIITRHHFFFGDSPSHILKRQEEKILKYSDTNLENQIQTEKENFERNKGTPDDFSCMDFDSLSSI